MILTRRVALDGAQMDQIDERIVIRGVEMGAGKESISAEALYGGIGSRVTSRHRDSLDITVRFALRLKRGDEAARAELLEKVNGWAAGGGWLTTNVKPDRRIRVCRASLPGDGETRDWLQEYAIVFRAYGVPYWQEETGTSGAQTSNGGRNQVTLAVNGYTETVVDLEYKNLGAAINTATIGVGPSVSSPESQFVLTGLGLGTGETLVIDHPDEGERSWLRIRIRGTNGAYRTAYGCRTEASSDDLQVAPGRKIIWITKSGNGTLSAAVRGRYW